MADAFQDFSDMLTMTVKEVAELASGFAKCAGGDKIIFGLLCVNHLKLMVHLVHDFECCGCDPSIEGMMQVNFQMAFARLFAQVGVLT